MKTSKYLWVMVCPFFSQVADAQSVEINAADPSAQLKQVFQLRHVGPPMLKMPDKIFKPQSAAISAFNIAKNMAEAKLKCPLLRLKPTLQLEGERSSNAEVGLKWETTNGFENRSFDVERSLGDTMNFKKINFVWARENQDDKYRLPDNNDYYDVSYYRLKLLLNNGQSVYSNTAVVKGYDDIRFGLYPNPAVNKLKINISTREDGSAFLTLHDALGRIVQQQSLYLAKRFDLKEINVSKLTGGYYTVKVVLPGNQVRIGRFLKN